MEQYIINCWMLESIPWDNSIKKRVLQYFGDYQHIRWQYIIENKLHFESECHKIEYSAVELKIIKDKSRQELSEMIECGVEVISPLNYTFPLVLRNYKPLVKLLYVKGNKSLLTSGNRIAIIGSRKPTAYGRKIAYDLSKYLAHRGVTIVSGLALGIDAMAHKGALDAGGNTVAVLPTDVNHVYPQTNTKIYQNILEADSLILSESRTCTTPNRYQFPLRNRIISAISDVVIIIEAGEKSGSLITAQHAIEQGKTVYALPGSILSPQSSGSNRLIYDGATPLINFEHVLESIGIDIEIMPDSINFPEGLSKLAKQIYFIVKKMKNLSLDEIVASTKFEYSEIFAAVSELILEDLCEYSGINEITLL
ncbi:DNA-processing protein DprA [Fusibacter bizertensis]|uniref:DNA-processing protein DprA n=1 Tax=Fusibacter bizertensis TaxID=1488331 RepID=A0ABT6N899_9FIRM|nr:DNA-processing protein DprA [Fusibacter bizertensis]MDH8676641.1 DNA-processing protein DprA [Fusibacter bizertensis]